MALMNRTFLLIKINSIPDYRERFVALKYINLVYSSDEPNKKLILFKDSKNEQLMFIGDGIIESIPMKFLESVSDKENNLVFSNFEDFLNFMDISYTTEDYKSYDEIIQKTYLNSFSKSNCNIENFVLFEEGEESIWFINRQDGCFIRKQPKGYVENNSSDKNMEELFEETICMYEWRLDKYTLKIIEDLTKEWPDTAGLLHKLIQDYMLLNIPEVINI